MNNFNSLFYDVIANCFPGDCGIPKRMKGHTKRCGQWYSFKSKMADHMSYTVGWNTTRTSVPDKLTDLEESFLYQTPSHLHGIPFWGYLTSYEAGGYVANLGQTLQSAQTMLNDLRKNSWIDRYTRAVLLEFNVLNIQSGLFTQVILSMEFPPVGGAYHWLDMTSVQLYRYGGALGVLNILTELTCVLVFLVFAGFTIKDVVKKGCAFFKSLRGITEILVIMFFITAMSLYAYRSVWTVRQIEYMMRNWGQYYL